MSPVESRFAEATLEQVCHLVTDGTHDTPKPVESGFPLVKAKEIGGGIIDFENCVQIAAVDHEQVIARSKPERGDTLFAHIGASLGEAAYVNTDRPFSIKNVALFKPNESIIDGRYLYYIVKSPAFQSIAKASRTGSAQPFLSLGHLRGHKIRYHKKLGDQYRVASILSAYDDLIRNNTRRIDILVEMARRVYDEWFVKFRYPGDSIGKRPSSWRNERLGDYLDVIETGSRPKGGVSEIRSGVPSIGAESIIGPGRFKYSKTKYVPRDFLRI